MSDDYDVGADQDEDMAMMYDAAEADLEAARSELVLVREYAARLETALVRAHACPTVRDDGECDGCYVSEVLASWPMEIVAAGSARSCTCIGECKGAAGLAPGWRCALEKP